MVNTDNMSSRCKACNNKLTDHELKKRILSLDKTRIEYAELCNQCIKTGDYGCFLIKEGKTIPILEVEDAE
jgi:uncharacterized protein with PIN domain